MQNRLPVNLHIVDRVKARMARNNGFPRSAFIPGDIYELHGGRRYMVGPRGNWLRVN